MAGGISFPEFTARVSHFSVFSPFVFERTHSFQRTRVRNLTYCSILCCAVRSFLAYFSIRYWFYAAVPGVMASTQIALCWNVHTEDSPFLANQ